MDIESTRLEKRKILENVDRLAERISSLSHVKNCVAKETLYLCYVRFMIYFENGDQRTFKEGIFSLTEKKLNSIYYRIKNHKS